MIRRTALITTASVAGVVVAGAALVGANIKILDSAAAEGMGELSATTIPVAEEVVVQGADESQTYAVDSAGTVTVERYGGELRLSEVTDTPGWSHSVSQQSEAVLVLAFTDGTTVYQFLAMIGPDGAINAGVSQPVDEIVVVPGAASASSAPSGAAAVPAPSATASPTPAPAPSTQQANNGASNHEYGGYDDYDDYEDHDDLDENDDHDENEEHDDYEEHEGGDEDD